VDGECERPVDAELNGLKEDAVEPCSVTDELE
jgi:hypothetical protein